MGGSGRTIQKYGSKFSVKKSAAAKTAVAAASATALDHPTSDGIDVYIEHEWLGMSLSGSRDPVAFFDGGGGGSMGTMKALTALGRAREH